MTAATPPTEHADGAAFVLTDEFERALDLLRAGGHLFITGKAGTGKSTLVRRFLDETDRRVLVAAPTGIAALNVGGYTLHRVFGFLPTTTLEDVRSGAYRPGRFARAITGLETLVIDEASMVRADLFDMLAAALERYGPAPGTPFGGVQIVLVGDLFQLPPVVTDTEAEFFHTVYDTPYFFSAGAYTRDAFPTAALTRVFRQSGDPRLTTMLNAIREGSLVTAAREELGARTDKEFEPPDGEFWLRLTTTNRIASARNRRRLERLDAQEFVHHAERIGELDRFEAPTDDVLRFKPGAQIMMLTNDDAERWVNGTIGRISDARWTDDGCVVTAQFTDGTVAEIGAHTWEVTRPVVDGGGLRHEVIGRFTQLPFKLAWAITIHKSQGQTVDRLIVDLTGGTFAYGQLYVALSRATSLDGLVLTRPVFPKDLKTDRRILRFLRAADSGHGAHTHCAIAALTVGEEAARSRPRPVELAVAFEDGTAATTLVNPQRDLADAHRAYGISTADVLLAPTLAEAWAMLAPLLDGHTPVGVEVDSTLGCIDFELKRLRASVAMPLGADLPPGDLTADERSALRSGRALERARAIASARRRLDAGDGSAGRFDAGSADDRADAGAHSEADAAHAGLLLSRDTDVPTPSSAHLPQLSAVLSVSRAAGGALLGLPASPAEAAPGPVQDPGALDEARALVAEQVRDAAGRAPVDADVFARLESLEALLGTDLTAHVERAESRGAADVLAAGTRVCFTGEAARRNGTPISREAMMALAERRGLTAVDNVTKTRCDALVTAEVATQSGKARKARDYGTPIIAADDFLAWAEG